MQGIKHPYQERIIWTENITTGYLNQKKKQIISDKLSLNIRNGELVALLGPNGCGKSTLMRTMGGLQKAISGYIFINGQNVQKMTASQRAKYLSLVLTEKIDSSNLTIKDIVSIGRYPYIGYMGKLSSVDWQIVNESLQACSLEDWGERFFSELSDGEKQRAMIARALAQSTPFMLLDEPTAHLDLPNRIEMMRMLNQLAKNTGKAILISTHELDLAMQWADTIWLMNNEGKVFSGIPEDIVLSGKVAEIFCNQHFYFDMKSANFKMNRRHMLPISINGEGIETEWTIRALERIGFTIATFNKAEIHLDISLQKWTLSSDGIVTGEFHSIEGMLTSLQNSNYWNHIYID